MISEEQKEKDKELEGREIVFLRDLDYSKESVSAIVTGIDYDIGITVQSTDGSYLMCVHGPLSPYIKGDSDYDIEIYEAVYVSVTEMMRNGVISAQALFYAHIRIGYMPGRGASVDTCAFAQ